MESDTTGADPRGCDARPSHDGVGRCVVEDIAPGSGDGGDDGSETPTAPLWHGGWRYAQQLFKAAGVGPYQNPFHSVRGTCTTDWGTKVSQKAVSAWAGHADQRTTAKH